MNDLKTLYEAVTGREVPVSIEMEKDFYYEYKHFPYTVENPNKDGGSDDDSEKDDSGPK